MTKKTPSVTTLTLRPINKHAETVHEWMTNEYVWKWSTKKYWNAHSIQHSNDVLCFITVKMQDRNCDVVYNSLYKEILKLYSKLIFIFKLIFNFYILITPKVKKERGGGGTIQDLIPVPIKDSPPTPMYGKNPLIVEF